MYCNMRIVERGTVHHPLNRLHFHVIWLTARHNLRNYHDVLLTQMTKHSHARMHSIMLEIVALLFHAISGKKTYDPDYRTRLVDGR